MLSNCITRQLSRPLHINSAILGQQFFIIYIFDIYDFTKEHLQGYTDDTLYLYSFNPEKLVNEQINDDLRSISKFSTVHNLKLNPDKTKDLSFVQENKKMIWKNQLKQYVNNLPVNFSIFNLLCVILDVKLKSIDHVNKIMHKSFVRAKVLFPSKEILSR